MCPGLSQRKSLGQMWYKNLKCCGIVHLYHKNYNKSAMLVQSFSQDRNNVKLTQALNTPPQHFKPASHCTDIGYR